MKFAPTAALRRAFRDAPMWQLSLVAVLTLVEFVLPLIWRANATLFVSPFGKDEGLHLVNAWRFFDALWQHRFLPDPSAIFSVEFVHARVVYPPLLYFASVLPQIVGGPSFVSAYLGLLPFYFLLNFSLFRLGNELEPNYGGLLGVLVLAACPFFRDHLGVFDLQLSLAAWMPLLALYLARGNPFVRLESAIAYGAIVAAAFLTYMWVGILWAIPIIAYFAYSLGTSKRKGEMIRNAAAAMVAVVLPILIYLMATDAWPWFYRAVPRLFSANAVATSFEPGRADGIGRAHYIVGAARALGFTLPLVLYGLTRLRRRRADAVVAIAAASAWLSPMAIASVYNERLLPLLPLAAAIAGVGMARATRATRYARWLAVGLLIWIAVSYGLATGPDRRYEASLPNLRDMRPVLEEQCQSTSRSLAVLCTSSAAYFSLVFQVATEPGPCLRPDHLYYLAVGVTPLTATHILNFAIESGLPSLNRDIRDDNPTLARQLDRFREAPDSWPLMWREGSGNDVLELLAAPTESGPATLKVPAE